MFRLENGLFPIIQPISQERVFCGLCLYNCLRTYFPSLDNFWLVYFRFHRIKDASLFLLFFWDVPESLLNVAAQEK